MKKHLSILLIFSLLSPYLVSAQTDPCQDKEFLRLKDVSINDMSEREYKYFMMMSERCTGDAEKVQTATLQYPDFDSDEKRIEFNNKRITIIPKGTTLVHSASTEFFNTGLFVGSSSVEKDMSWMAYEGYSSISLVSFLDIVGEHDTANRMSAFESVKDRRGVAEFLGFSDKEIAKWELLDRTQRLLGIVFFGSGILMVAKDDYSDEAYLFGYVFGWSFLLYCIFWPFITLNKVQKAVFHPSILQKKLFGRDYQNYFPVQQAVEMADGYNRQLWREITNR
jgi:hypothetical protein